MASTGRRNCYTRNGTLINDVAYQACNNDTSRDSVCCGLNHQGAGRPQVANDVCESNGLCQNFEAYDGTNEGEKLWWRQGCTDPTWQSEFCLASVCNFAMWQGDNAPVRKCGDNSWCCGEKNCCNISSSLFALAATVGQGQASTSRSSSPASSISASTTASNTVVSTTSTGGFSSATASTSTTPAPAAGGLSTGAKAGIGVGAAAVFILLCVVAFLSLKLWKRKQSEKRSTADALNYANLEKDQSAAYVSHVPPVELSGESAPAEMGERPAAELAGNNMSPRPRGSRWRAGG